ncbi:hypothetical protein U6B65_00210 [Oscillospiraceae bacterium MB08-C2-2]|nr:hypothetical protein U6B65_00210 [Oscillospiraceae bacterium MB08-C2-2]
MAQKLFGNRIDPACRYCSMGFWSNDSKMILCTRKGIVAPDFHCRRFDYDPLRRIPRRLPALPEFDPAEFAL